jgi:excisionase family DNA binding protein
MWMTIDEIAAYLQVSKETIYKMVQKNQIPASKLGGQWRFNKDTVDTWLNAQSNIQLNDIKKVALNG